MTQNTQTTAERIESILRRDLDVDVIVSRGGDPHYNEADIVGVNIAAQTIAAEIDTLTRERDEARAEAERLRPAAEAWEATEAWRAVGMHIENRRGRDDAYQAMDRAAARARAAKEKQP